MITKTFEVLLEKLRTVPPGRRLAVVDWWVGALFLTRAAIESGRFKGGRSRTTTTRRRGSRPR